MKILFFFLVLLTSLLAEKLTIGAGPYFQTQPYKNVDTITVPSPVVFYDNGIFYVRWTRAGVYFLGEKKDDHAWGFSLTLQPRPYGYKASDSKILSGMQERKNTWEGGVAFSAQIDTTYVEMMLLNDLLNNSNAWILKVEVGDEFHLSDFTFYPSVLAIYQSSEFINYYYGVKESEATSFRTAYSSNAGIDFAVQTYINYPLTKKLSTLVNLRADLLSSKITHSPIVTDTNTYSGLLSLIYTFEY